MSESSIVRLGIFRLLDGDRTGFERLVFSNDELVYQNADSADRLFLIESGEIRLLDAPAEGGRRLLEILGRNQWFGYASLGHLETRGELAVSVGKSVVWAVPADQVRSRLAADSQMACEFISAMAEKLQMAWLDGSRFAFQSCSRRVIRALLRFSNSPAAHAAADGVELHITHLELAEAVGATRERISMCLKQLKEMDLVRTGRNRLYFDPIRLQQLDHPSSHAREPLVLAV